MHDGVLATCKELGGSGGVTQMAKTFGERRERPFQILRECLGRLKSRVHDR